MKNKLIILLGMIVVFAIGLHWLSHSKEQSRSVLSSQAVESNTPAIPSYTRTQGDAQQIGTNRVAEPTPAGQPAPQIVSHAALVEQMSAAIEAKNLPLKFYGKAIDQDSNALSGVSIEVWVRHWQPGSWKGIRLSKVTDSDGRFELSDVTGDAFDIEKFSKDGYELEPGQSGFGAIGGSIENPVLFKMWGTNIHEQLITGEKSFQPVTDGRSYFINLTDGAVSEISEGDLKVWIQYTNQTVRGQSYDWSCRVDVVNGGLLEEPNNNSSMYVAPTEGYMPAFHLEQQIKGGQRGSIGDKRFYLMLKNGQEYGRMKIDLIAPYNPSMGVPAMIRLSYVINPSGSLILR